MMPLTPEQGAQRINKGLKLTDRLSDLVKMNPKRIEEVYDLITKPKLQTDFQQVGKPNVLMSFSGIQNNEYVMTQLNNMSVEEFIEIAEYLGDNPKSQDAYRRIFEQIMKDKMENEYNRTKVEDRYGQLINTEKKD